MADDILKGSSDLLKPEITSLINNEDVFTALAKTSMIAKKHVPYSHKRVADNYMIIKRIYKFQAVQSRISNQEISLLQKFDLNTLEYTTIKQMNEELEYLKKWSVSTNEELRKDSDKILQIRVKELKYLVASCYVQLTNEVYNGYKALEKYLEEISKFDCKVY